MASNIPLTRGFATKIKAEIGKFIWHGQTLQRIAFANLILPKSRGGLNLNCPETKSKALYLNRMIGLAHQLPFITSFLQNPNNPAPAMFNHITVLKAELAQLPDILITTPTSCGFYRHFLTLKPDPGFVSTDPRDWKIIFKHLHNRILNSTQRSNWFVVMHRKIKHRELLYQRGVIDNPYCETCPGELETTVHKLFRCQVAREIWRFHRREIVSYEPRLAALEPQEFVYPALKRINRTSRNSIIKLLGLFFSYHIETPENSVSIINAYAY